MRPPPPEHLRWKRAKAETRTRGRQSPDVRAARKLTQVEFERICANLFNTSTQTLRRDLQRPADAVLTALIARILERGIAESCRVELNYFIERFLGKSRRKS